MILNELKDLAGGAAVGSVAYILVMLACILNVDEPENKSPVDQGVGKLILEAFRVLTSSVALDSRH